jgi:hypothetical protein
MVALAVRTLRRVPSRLNIQWGNVLRGTYTWLRDFVPAIGGVAASAEGRAEAEWLRAGQRFGEAIAAQRLAESYNDKGQRVSAVGVLADAAAQFSDGRFPATSVELLRRIVDDEHNASALRTVAETCLKHGERKHLVAAVCLLGMAYQHDLTDTRALELLVCAFEKMGLAEKARRVEAVLAEISAEELALPAPGKRSPGAADE